MKPFTLPLPRATYRPWIDAEWTPSACPASQITQRAASRVASSAAKIAVSSSVSTFEARNSAASVIVIVASGCSRSEPFRPSASARMLS